MTVIRQKCQLNRTQGDHCNHSYFILEEVSSTCICLICNYLLKMINIQTFFIILSKNSFSGYNCSMKKCQSLPHLSALQELFELHYLIKLIFLYVFIYLSLFLLHLVNIPHSTWQKSNLRQLVEVFPSANADVLLIIWCFERFLMILYFL